MEGGREMGREGDGVVWTTGVDILLLRIIQHHNSNVLSDCTKIRMYTQTRQRQKVHELSSICDHCLNH